MSENPNPDSQNLTLEPHSRPWLVALCDRAVVPWDRWYSRETANSMAQVGKLRALLLAGCDFRVADALSDDDSGNLNVEVWPDDDGWESFCLPTPQKLEEADGDDWY